MDWIALLVIAALVISFIFIKRSGQIGEEEAREHLKNGALVVDVRSPGEFSSGHLRGAINLPLDGIESTLPRRVKDKDQVLLLHCQSGTRSGIAVRKLNSIGYANAFNIGSYGRASRLVSSK